MLYYTCLNVVCICTRRTPPHLSQIFKSILEMLNKPYARRLQAMEEIAQMYKESGDDQQYRYWLQKLVNEDKGVLNNIRSAQTRSRVSLAYLKLARMEKNKFEGLKLALPLSTSLDNKKSAMQRAVALYGQAAVHKDYDITTEATYSIALIYNRFSESLLASDRPENLTVEELDQYEILLEDQAFPFQDKAIEFLEINLSRVKDGLYNDWIERSHRQLVKLFPLRYDRSPIQDSIYREM